jgi:Taurine catabolism dioxygenase TauD, TfdA family
MHLKSMAPSGGEQHIASFWTIYNRLITEHPETLRTLAEDWNWMPHRL